MVVPKDKVGSGSGRRCWVTAKFYGNTKEEVSGKSKEYFSEYDPRGYDTRVITPPRHHSDGYWYTVIERYSTCS
jgi:hypothetical protein